MINSGEDSVIAHNLRLIGSDPVVRPGVGDGIVVAKRQKSRPGAAEATAAVGSGAG